MGYSVGNRDRDKLYWLKVWMDFKSGDKNSFGIIYNEFIDILYTYGSKITSDRELIKDSIQDLFVDIYNYSIELRQPEYLEYYLIKSLKRIIINKLKSNNRYDQLTAEHNYTFHLKFDFEEKYIQEESSNARYESLKEILRTLDQEKRELLFLKFNTGLNYIQIGEVLDMKPDTVKKQIYRLLEQIRKKHGTKLLELFFATHK